MSKSKRRTYLKEEKRYTDGSDKKPNKKFKTFKEHKLKNALRSNDIEKLMSEEV